MACNPLSNLARECGKNATSGLRDEVYLVPFDALKNIVGSTEVYATSVGGLINKIEFAVPATKFSKYGTVKKQNGIVETYTYNENGSYDIQKELTFNLGNIGSVLGKKAVEDLIGNPVCALIKMQSGQWLVFGLNGQFQMSGSAGEVAAAANQRVVTLSGSDVEFIQVVDPTIVAALIAA